MINEAEALQRLRPILAEILVLNEHEVRTEARLVDDLDADSVAFLELNYRMEQEFALQVPRPKATEEMLSFPLVEVLGRKGFEGTDPGLLEYMTGEMLFAARQDPEIHGLLQEQFRRSLTGPEFRADFRAALERSRTDPALRKDLVGLAHAFRQTSELTPYLEQLLAEDPETGALCQELLDEAAADPAAAPTTLGLPTAWATLFRDAPVRRSLSEITTQQFARLLGTTPPLGVAPALPVGQLRLRDLFRFLTVGFYVGYIVFLSRKQALGPPAQKREAQVS